MNPDEQPVNSQRDTLTEDNSSGMVEVVGKVRRLTPAGEATLAALQEVKEQQGERFAFSFEETDHIESWSREGMLVCEGSLEQPGVHVLIVGDAEQEKEVKDLAGRLERAIQGLQEAGKVV